MPTITTQGPDSITLNYLDTGGTGRPIVLIHGWPLNLEAWSATTPALTQAGYRVIAYDRRGFGDSDKPDTGYDYDTLSDDLHALITQLDVQNAVLVGYSMGGGEVVRYLSRHAGDRATAGVLMAATPPALLISPTNPDGGLTSEMVEGMIAGLRADREGFLREFMTGFFTPAGGEFAVSQEVLADTLHLADKASLTAVTDCIRIWGEDFREEMKQIQVPMLIMHGDADQSVPAELSARRSHELLPNSELVLIPGGPHGIYATHTDQINQALLDFLGRL